MSENDLSSLALLASLSLHESELHGLVSGMIVRSPHGDEHSIARLVDRIRPGLCDRHALEQFSKTVYDDLVDPQCTYSLLLPTDDEELHARVTGLRMWLLGFLEAVRPLAESKLSGPQADFFHEFHSDLEQVAELEDIDDSDEEDLEEIEEALTSILEFLRIGVLNMFEIIKDEEI
ncbi:MAG: UPF0149 family protein [Gammaproteobacteria bacterium]|nr:UPF0149 family protein [Gammaproteobacteria bacterium]MYF37338.1 UPF0149 family protein [Gammaproteobacteria bacterium]